MEPRRLVLAGDHHFAAFNPNEEPDLVRGQLLEIVKRIVPDIPYTGLNQVDIYYHERAQDLCVFLSMKELREGRKPTLLGIARYLVSGPSGLAQQFSDEKGPNLVDGFYQTYGSLMRNVYDTAYREFVAIFFTTQKAVGSFVSLTSVATLLPFIPVNEE